MSVNLEQQVAEDVGVFARAGWADGNVEPWDLTDFDRTVEDRRLGVGQTEGPDRRYTVGIAGVVNGITGVHGALFDAGGLGILVGDGQLPHPGLEQILYALTSSTHLSVDYQFIANPGYNTDRGPVNVFSGRIHWQFLIDDARVAEPMGGAIWRRED